MSIGDGSNGLVLTVKKAERKRKTDRRKGMKMAPRHKKPSKGKEEGGGLGRAGCEA